MYEPARQIDTFYVAGFQYYDGAMVLGVMKAGDSVQFALEPDNPHDPEAIVLSCSGAKIGYVPKSANDALATMAFFGHADAFEMRILQVAPEEAPWEQVRVGVFVRDARADREGE